MAEEHPLSGESPSDVTPPGDAAHSGRPRRGSFGPIVIAGLAGGLLATVAGTKHWVSSSEPQAMLNAQGVGLDAPGVTALGLVVLAAWGVVLVTRGRMRRAVLVVAGIAAVAAIPVDFSSRHGLPHGSSTAWPWLALVGAVVALAAACGGVLLARAWPEMGRKYDAPTGAQTPDLPLEEQSNLDLWKSIGEGHDPTAERSE